MQVRWFGIDPPGDGLKAPAVAWPTMDLGIDGRVALVTGASQGIGHACAEALAEAGCAIALNARGEDRLEAAADELRKTGAEVVPVPGDVGDAEDVEAIVDRTRREIGDPGILVANAGGPPPGSFRETSDADWQAGFELTLMSFVRLARAVVDAMQEQGWGRIVAITSRSVKEPIDRLVLSNSLRLAVVGAMKTLSREVAGDGVTVNSVAPGSTATDRILDLAEDRADRAGVPADEMADRMRDAIPVGRFAKPREIGDVVAFLCSERAAFLTGQVVPVDGGSQRGY